MASRVSRLVVLAAVVGTSSMARCASAWRLASAAADKLTRRRGEAASAASAILSWLVTRPGSVSARGWRRIASRNRRVEISEARRLSRHGLVAARGYAAAARLSDDSAALGALGWPHRRNRLSASRGGIGIIA
jgi:hypothetical protein